MNNKTIIIYLFSILLHIFFANNSFADTTEVYCATPNKKWEWLKQNGKIVSVKGEWVYFTKEFSENRTLHLKYFKLDGDWRDIENLQNKCVDNYGSSYAYAQVANGFMSGWHLIGTDNTRVAKGVYELANRCIFCFTRNPPFSLYRENLYNHFNLEKYFNEF